MSVGKRLRFEILKRDGFRCRYCGRSPMSSVLRVDHVVPVAGGGTDDPANLVTACHDCNAGKSDVPLDETISRSPTVEEMHEQARNLDGFREGCEALTLARQRLDEWLAGRWEWATGRVPRGRVLTRLRNVLEEHGEELLDDAVRALRDAKQHGTYGGACALEDPYRYFNGIVRGLVAERETNTLTVAARKIASEIEGWLASNDPGELVPGATAPRVSVWLHDLQAWASTARFIERDPDAAALSRAMEPLDAVIEALQSWTRSRQETVPVWCLDSWCGTLLRLRRQS